MLLLINPISCSLWDFIAYTFRRWLEWWKKGYVNWRRPSLFHRDLKFSYIAVKSKGSELNCSLQRVYIITAVCNSMDRMRWRARFCTGTEVDSSWNVMAHGDAREGKWRGNWRMEWVASTLHTTLEHGVSSITTADAHTSAASSRLNWRPRRFKWTRPFRRKTKSGFCACVITFQLASTTN